VQHLNRIGRRIIMWMLLIAALAIFWSFARAMKEAALFGGLLSKAGDQDCQ
jgi:hypothetical protein